MAKAYNAYRQEEMQGNIVDLFFKAAERDAAKTAIVYQERQVTYGQLAAKVRDTSQYLQAKGIAKGDRVLVFVPMSIDLYRVVLAIFNIGAVAVFVDEWVGRDRLLECCRMADCKGFIGIFKARVLAYFYKDLRKIPIKMGLSYRPTRIGALPVEVGKEDTALLTFTTGSTGTPKAANRTHGFLMRQFDALEDEMRPESEDVVLTTLPIVLLFNLGAGSTSVIMHHDTRRPEKNNMQKIVQTMRHHHVNCLMTSPYLAKQLALHVQRNKESLTAMEKIFTGGGPVYPADAALMIDAFPGRAVKIFYGSTEAEPICTIDAKVLALGHDYDQKGLCVGTPYKHAEVKVIRIIDGVITCSTEKEFSNLCLPVGSIGEIVVSGAHVLDAYHNSEEALQMNKIFIEGKCYHRTGDSGWYDEQGRIFLTGRCSSLFNVGESLVAPFIYEQLLMGIAGVELGTVLKLDERIVAVAEAGGEAASAVELRSKILALPLKIDDVKLVIKIPRDPRHHSKIDYHRLRTMMLKA